MGMRLVFNNFKEKRENNTIKGRTKLKYSTLSIIP